MMTNPTLEDSVVGADGCISLFGQCTKSDDSGVKCRIDYEDDDDDEDERRECK